MDNGEIELSDPLFLPDNSGVSSNAHRRSDSVDSIIDELLKNTKTCTHTHTCNPPGPDAAHTHTCYHIHSQMFSSGEDTKIHSETARSLKPRRPLGNREAVRKYREKKKAHTAYLEEEVKKLRLLNQQLVKKLQGQAILEAEILRLRSILFDLRGKIDNELGSFPFQAHCSSNTTITFKEGDSRIHSAGSTEVVGLQCQADIPCFQARGNQSVPMGNDGGANEGVFSWEENCHPAHPAIVDCHVNVNGNGNRNGNVTIGGSDYQPEDTKNQGQ